MRAKATTTSASSRWSQRMPVIPSAVAPSGADRPVMYTRAPSRASARATPRPTPHVPPVMTATRSLRDDMREYSEDVVGAVKSSGGPADHGLDREPYQRPTGTR